MPVSQSTGSYPCCSAGGGARRRAWWTRSSSRTIGRSTTSPGAASACLRQCPQTALCAYLTSGASERRPCAQVLCQCPTGSRRFPASAGVRPSVCAPRARDKEHSTIIYESPQPNQPLLRLGWNKQDPRYMATLLLDCAKVVVLDIRCCPSHRPSAPHATSCKAGLVEAVLFFLAPAVPCSAHAPLAQHSYATPRAPRVCNRASAPLACRFPTLPVAELQRHTAPVNALAWAPHSSCHICTAGDDAQALIWDLSSMSQPLDQDLGAPAFFGFFVAWPFHAISAMLLSDGSLTDRWSTRHCIPSAPSGFSVWCNVGEWTCVRLFVLCVPHQTHEACHEAACLGQMRTQSWHTARARR